MLLGMVVTVGSMFMMPLLIWLCGGLTWWSVLLGSICFLIVLAAGARLWGWAIDQGFMWLRGELRDPLRHQPGIGVNDCRGSV